jgi:hypothetical protein
MSPPRATHAWFPAAATLLASVVEIWFNSPRHPRFSGIPHASSTQRPGAAPRDLYSSRRPTSRCRPSDSDPFSLLLYASGSPPSRRNPPGRPTWRFRRRLLSAAQREHRQCQEGFRDVFQQEAGLPGSTHTVFSCARQHQPAIERQAKE